MQRVGFDIPWPLHDSAATRVLEHAAASTLPPHTLMQRAGLAVARLSLALAPHARTFWIACGPGNNGGDGLEAALHLLQWGKTPVVTWLGDEARCPPDTLASLHRARDAGVAMANDSPDTWDFGIDALLGLGRARAMEGRMAQWAASLGALRGRVLAIDLPSGLDPDTGNGEGVAAAHTLSLLTLKPGLFTGNGRDACGEVWFDGLGVSTANAAPVARLGGPIPGPARLHASHKGSYGDVGVIGGAPGMTGAARLAASAALHSGAGRVFVCFVGRDAVASDDEGTLPDLMVRSWGTLDLRGMSVACGCGGGDVVRAVLPRVISAASNLVLDADALNAIAIDTQLQSLLAARGARQRSTVLTPHPLEAARLLGCSAAEVQADRLRAAGELVRRFGCIVVLKGSGTIIAGHGQLPLINPTGNARLAIAGTGDVLAGMIAAAMAGGAGAFEAAAGAVHAHGLRADRWPANRPLIASALAAAVEPPRN